jgi:hypothetical protein
MDRTLEHRRAKNMPIYRAKPRFDRSNNHAKIARCANIFQRAPFCTITRTKYAACLSARVKSHNERARPTTS